jgi:hypothetical protein
MYTCPGQYPGDLIAARPMHSFSASYIKILAHLRSLNPMIKLEMIGVSSSFCTELGNG